MTKAKQAAKSGVKELGVVSTLAASVRYQLHQKAHGPGAVPPVAREVLVRGGAGVMDRRLEETPGGVFTPISREEAEFLSKCPEFQFHEKGGFVKIVEREKDPEVVAADMAPASDDPSAPLTPSDYPEDGNGVQVKADSGTN